MKCLLKYQWVKLQRNNLPAGKGIMGYWAKLASKAAFRKGQASYCGYINDVNAGTWSGGVTGLKSILGVKSRQEALDIMNTLQCLGYIEFDLNPMTKKLTYKIIDYVLKCTGAPCLGSGAVYAVDGYGFICLPRDITQRLAEDGYTFEEADAWLDLWCHSVWQDPRNIFSDMAPVVQYGQHGAVLTLESLGKRWNWEKTKVWRFLQKNKDSFTLHKLPGSYGCLIFNMLYPTGETSVEVKHTEVIRILDEIRIAGQNTHTGGTDNERINKHIAWFSERTVKCDISSKNPDRMSDSVNSGGVKAKHTLPASVLTMAQWLDEGSPVGTYWVIDADGWAYWTKPLMPGEATGLLLDKVTLKSPPELDYYYGILVDAQMATLDGGIENDNLRLRSGAVTDNYTRFGEEGQGGWTDNGHTLVESIVMNRNQLAPTLDQAGNVSVK